MSWLSDLGESLFDVTTDLKLADQKSWLEPLISAGSGYLAQKNQNDAQKDYLNYLKQQEQQNYQDSVAQINAYNAAGAAGSGGGGGGAGRANEAKRYKAAKKANKSLQGTYKQILEMYAPFRKTAETLLPQMSQTYQNSLGMQNALAQYVNSPQQVAKLDAAGPAWNVNVPLPDYMKGRL